VPWRSFGQLAGLEVDPTRPAIVVDGVTETFRLYQERPSGLKERLYRLRRTSYTDFNALEDVSFRIEHGESVAVIGHNGSGKSTLLKILARILPPDEGMALTNGRVASLLELGAGFHGDLTGRENIYLNGAILGLSRADIDERFDQIVDFAGIRPLLDTAVRTYSSGLYVRLGFAIAVNVDPDILLVDEVLAVGDAEFQERSLDRMQEFRDAGKTFVLVSHDLDAVQKMCDRVIVLETGRVVFDGPVADGVERYRARTSRIALPEAARQVVSERVVIDEVVLRSPNGAPVSEVAPSTPVVVRVRLTALDDLDACSVGLRVTRSDGTPLYESHTAWQGLGVGPLAAGMSATVDIRLSPHLLSGHYTVTASVTDASTRETWAVRADAARFGVQASRHGAGLVDLRASPSVAHGPARDLDADVVHRPGP
jgi:ABC-type polysaccharide/polyol phosphate transport system ATPase subunit